jgi:hypothetical protein
MEAMPKPDAVPSPRSSTVQRFLRTLKWQVLFAAAVAIVAVVLVGWGDPTVHTSFMIATALGAGLTILLGTALMTLVFLSSSSGHDEQAQYRGDEE